MHNRIRMSKRPGRRRKIAFPKMFEISEKYPLIFHVKRVFNGVLSIGFRVFHFFHRCCWKWLPTSLCWREKGVWKGFGFTAFESFQGVLGGSGRQSGEFSTAFGRLRFDRQIALAVSRCLGFYRLAWRCWRYFRIEGAVWRWPLSPSVLQPCVTVSLHRPAGMTAP